MSAPRLPFETRNAKLARNIAGKLSPRVGCLGWEDYKRRAVELGFLVRRNGLAATVVYLAHKNRYLLEDLYTLDDAPWFRQEEHGGDVGRMVEAIAGSSQRQQDYMRATRFALAAAEWFKRLAESLPESGSTTDDEAPTAGVQEAARQDSPAPKQINPRAERFRNWKPKASCNPGQLLAFGYHDPDEHVSSLLKEIEGLEVPEVYKAAYKHWCRHCQLNNYAIGVAKLRDRAFLGLGCASVLETHVQLHRVFGMPFVSGETLKGVTRAYAKQLMEKGTLTGEQFRWLFGAPSKGDDTGAAGNLQFHDAWWIPEGKPLTLEIDTPHHPKYYEEQGASDATDYDDPEPHPHLAVTGSFLVAISSHDLFAAGLAVQIATKALQTLGVGGRKSAGYGLVSSIDSDLTDGDVCDVGSP
ncbi:MAG: type III-B CRISPR module RAMP protein Cmr6 [Methylococcaceae bacterium]|nr:type III-B CRISPR module RAMP protein Cmr6 [Methylococcaceae bacterium]